MHALNKFSIYYRWEKVWRAGCWAALGNATQAKYELQLTIQRDFEVSCCKFSMWILQVLIISVGQSFR